MDIPFISVVGIKIRDCGVVKKVGAQDFALEDGDRVLLEMNRGMTYGVAVEVVPAFDHPKMTFTYTAEGRVDFRRLVKDLATRFRTRIQMQQIGARDEAKHIGGLGLCGLVLCCSSFLTEFNPVTMKMVRAQGLPLDDSKLLGLCGRLKCCLAYEYQEGVGPSGPGGSGEGLRLIQPERLSASN